MYILLIMIFLDDCDLSHNDFQDLQSKQDFYGCKLHSTDFTGADLKRADFFHTEGFRTIFRSAQMPHATINKCTFDRADFSNAYLKSLKIGDSDFFDCDFSEAQLKNASFFGGRQENNDYVSADLTRTFFKKVEFRNCHFDKSNLMYTKFEGCLFTNCTFDSEVEGVSFRDCDFSGQDLTSLNMLGVKSMEGTNIMNAKIHADAKDRALELGAGEYNENQLEIREIEKKLPKLENWFRSFPDNSQLEERILYLRARLQALKSVEAPDDSITGQNRKGTD